MLTSSWRRALCTAQVLAFFLIATLAAASAAETLRAGQTIEAKTGAVLDTATLKEGDTIVLDVVPPYPGGNDALAGATVSLHVTSVSHTAQRGNARVAFLIDHITLKNGEKKPLYAQILASNVVARSATPQPRAIPLPNPTFAPSSSTIFWHKKLGPPSQSSAQTGGYADAKQHDVQLAAGSPVKLQLTKDLAIP